MCGWEAAVDVYSEVLRRAGVYFCLSVIVAEPRARCLCCTTGSSHILLVPSHASKTPDTSVAGVRIIRLLSYSC